MSNVPDGYYPGVLVKAQPEDGGEVWAQFGRSKEKLTPYIQLLFEITEGEYVGRRLNWTGYFTEASVDRTAESLRLAGFEGGDLVTFPNQDVKPKPVSLKVKAEEFEGRWFSKIAFVNAPGGNGVKVAQPMSGDDLRTFSAQMKARLSAAPRGRQPASAGGNGGQQTLPPVPPDSDIPF